MTDDQTIFGQRRDLWFHAMTVLFAAMVVMFVVVSLSVSWVFLIAAAGVAVVLATFVLPNYFYGRYELGEEAVHVRFYRTNLLIPYRDIIYAGPVSWWKCYVSTVATSLKFVEIHYRDGRRKRRIVFTPTDRERFVEELNFRLAQKRTVAQAPMFPR